MTKTTLDLEMLIVDDNRGMLSLLRSIFRQLGIERIELFERANDALDYLDHGRPDLILTDWEMEPLSGIEFVRLLRQHSNPAVKRIPVIMVTAHAAAERVMEARDTGVTEFLVKPISHKTASEKLRAIITKPRLFVRTLDYTGPDRRRMSKPFVGVDRRRNIDHFFGLAQTAENNAIPDAEQELSRMSPRELLAHFEETLSERVAAIHAELDAADADPLNRRGHIGRLFRMAHDLKGQGSTFNYPLITRLGAALCRFIDETDDFAAPETTIIRKFVDAMRVIADHRIRQDGGNTGRALLAKMNQIVLDYENARSGTIRPTPDSGKADAP